jgi:hypothetical protein
MGLVKDSDVMEAVRAPDANGSKGEAIELVEMGVRAVP